MEVWRRRKRSFSSSLNSEVQLLLGLSTLLLLARLVTSVQGSDSTTTVSSVEPEDYVDSEINQIDRFDDNEERWVMGKVVDAIVPITSLNETLGAGLADNSLWHGLLSECGRSTSLMCVKRNVFGYLDRSIGVIGDFAVTDSLVFKKNANQYENKYERSKNANESLISDKDKGNGTRGNKVKGDYEYDYDDNYEYDEDEYTDEEGNEVDPDEAGIDEPRSLDSFEGVTNILYDKGIRFVMNHDLQFQLPDTLGGALVRISPRALEQDGGALLKVEMNPAKTNAGEGRIFFKKRETAGARKVVLQFPGEMASARQIILPFPGETASARQIILPFPGETASARQIVLPFPGEMASAGAALVDDRGTNKEWKKKLLMSFFALLLVIKMIKVKLMYLLPLLIGVGTAKKLLLKMLLFLFPAFAHLFKFCSTYHASHTSKFHHHHHQLSTATPPSSTTIIIRYDTHSYLQPHLQVPPPSSSGTIPIAIYSHTSKFHHHHHQLSTSTHPSSTTTTIIRYDTHSYLQPHLQVPPPSSGKIPIALYSHTSKFPHHHQLSTSTHPSSTTTTIISTIPIAIYIHTSKFHHHHQVQYPYLSTATHPSSTTTTIIRYDTHSYLHPHLQVPPPPSSSGTIPIAIYSHTSKFHHHHHHHHQLSTATHPSFTTIIIRYDTHSSLHPHIQAPPPPPSSGNIPIAIYNYTSKFPHHHQIFRPLALSSASLKPILWDGGRGEGVVWLHSRPKYPYAPTRTDESRKP
uniref:Uncharacterized protein n=1 Tax=Timema monikensis TaxID=170555 RepID=A0A7R9EHL0_9NEOP|nr:unnamed protein product [Timema monikensis]